MEKRTKNRKGGWPLLPLALFILLLFGSFACGWLIWEKYATLRADAVNRLQERKKLEEELDRLNSLLALPPCESLARLRAEKR